MSACAVTGCERAAVSRGWCRRHYLRWQRHGDPLHERPSVAARIRRRVKRIGECDIWLGARGSDGYGAIKVNGRIARPHRVVWELHHGPIPDGLFVLHSCDTPLCARADHLMLGTQRANVQDMLRKGRRPKHRAA